MIQADRAAGEHRTSGCIPRKTGEGLGAIIAAMRSKENSPILLLLPARADRATRTLVWTVG
jgi:hypothetical protein